MKKYIIQAVPCGSFYWTIIEKRGLICIDTNRCCVASRSTLILGKFTNCSRHLSNFFFFFKFCHSIYFCFGEFVVTRDFPQSYEMADFQTCERQVTVFYQKNVYHRKFIFLYMMTLFSYKLGSLRRLNRTKHASLRYKLTDSNVIHLRRWKGNIRNVISRKEVVLSFRIICLYVIIISYLRE